MRVTYLVVILCLLMASAVAQSGFQTQSINLPGHQELLLSADLNGDGKPDLVLFGTGMAAVMLNNGDGSFAAPVVIDSTILNMHLMQVGDFNNDGIPDLVGCGTDAHENSHLIIYLNDGSGNFTASDSENFDCRALQVGDLNDDGNQDVIAGIITVFYGDGTGHFSGVTSETLDVNPTQQSQITGCFASDLRAADFIGDGNVHLLVIGSCPHPANQPNVPGQDTASYGTIYFGQNDGTGNFTFSEAFEAPVDWEFTGNPVDVDGDRRLDALMVHTLNQVINGQQILLAVDIAFNQGGGNFQVVDMYNQDATGSNNTVIFSAASADFEIDGLPDVVVGYELSGATAIDMVDGASNTNWTITDTWDPGGRIHGLIAGDFNVDGLPDIAAIALHSDLTTTLLIYSGTQ